MEKIIGIYKITSPTKKIYIGQSKDIYKRWKEYKRLKCKSQPRLVSSFKKYGINKHKFEIVLICEIEQLNEMERYYQDLYSSINRSGLNCLLTKASDRKCETSQETKDKIRKTLTGRPSGMKGKIKLSQERKDAIGNFFRGRPSGRIGIKLHSEETKQFIREKESILVINLQTGIFYPSIKEAAISANIPHSSLTKRLSGFWKNNNTNFAYAN